MEDPSISSSLIKRISSLLKKIFKPIQSSSQTSLSAHFCLQSPSSKRKTKESSTEGILEQGLTDLPTEIIFNILSRLPSRSLCRFKSVSRTWLALITDPIFIQSHFHQFVNDNNRRHKVILGSSSGSIYCVDYQSLDYSSVELKMLFNYRIHFVRYHGSFNGTTLLDIEMSALLDGHFCLWNPSIGMSQTFSGPIYIKWPKFYGLGYDFATDDFKVCAGYSENSLSPVHVFSSKLGSWRRIGDIGYEYGYPIRKETVFKGMPHWVVDHNRYGITSAGIVCFDFTEEKFVEVPRPCYGRQNNDFILGVLGGCLCVVDRWLKVFTVSDVWVMKEYVVKFFWTKLFRVPFVEGEFFCYHLEVLCFTTDGDVVMSLNRQKLVVYNPKRNSYRRIDPKVCRQFGERFSMGSLDSPHGCNEHGSDRNGRESGHSNDCVEH